MLVLEALQIRNALNVCFYFTVVFLDWTQRFVVVMLMKIIAFRAVVFTLNGWYRLSSHPANFCHCLWRGPGSATLRAVSNRVRRSLRRCRLTTVRAGSASGEWRREHTNVLASFYFVRCLSSTKCVVLKIKNKIPGVLKLLYFLLKMLFIEVGFLVQDAKSISCRGDSDCLVPVEYDYTFIRSFLFSLWGWIDLGHSETN